MKIFAANSICDSERCRRGFTLTEMLVSSTIFLIIIGAAMISVQVYGLRVYNLATTKVKATTSARETINDIRDQVRSAQLVYVGTYTNSAFTTNATGVSQIGNALQIFPATNTTAANAIVFYMDPNNTNMNMVSNGVVSVEASNMTNYYCFQAENYQGTILTNYANNPVIAITMMFNQLAFPAGYVGGVATNAFDYYRLHTRVCVRAKN